VRNVRQESESLEGDIEGQRSATAELMADVEGQKGRLDQAINEHQAQFGTEQAEREQQFKESQEAHESSAQASLGRLAGMEEKAKRQLDVIGVVGMSGGYQQVAD